MPLYLCSSFLLQSNRHPIFLEQSDSFLGFCFLCCHHASLFFSLSCLSQQSGGACRRNQRGASPPLCKVLSSGMGIPKSQGLGASAEEIKQHKNSVFLMTQIKAHYFLNFFSGSFSVLYRCFRSCCQKNKCVCWRG